MMPVERRRSIHAVHASSRKKQPPERCGLSGGCFCGASGLLSFVLVVKPFANEVRNNACRDRREETKEAFHAIHLPLLPVWERAAKSLYQNPANSARDRGLPGFSKESGQNQLTVSAPYAKLKTMCLWQDTSSKISTMT